MSQENVDRVRRGYAAWNQGDMDEMLALLDPAFEYVTSGLFPAIASVYRGHQGWMTFAHEFREPWEWLQITVQEVRDGGERVAARFRFEAQGRDGLEVQRPFANVWSFRNGLAVKLQAFSEWLEALEAAGLSE